MKSRVRCSHCIQCLYCILISLLFLPDLNASNYYYKQISVREGLSQSFVQCIYDDHKGFLWIGTKSGLNRYHENEIKIYLNTPSSGSLPDNNIIFITEDSLKNLWVSTERGLSLYNRESDDFTTVQHYGHNLLAHAYFGVEDGIIFASDRLFKYSYETREFTFLPHQTPDGNNIGNIIFIRPWRNNEWILGTKWKGVWIYDFLSGNLRPFNGFDGKDISAFHLDSKGRFWISPYGKGIYRFTSEGKPDAHYDTANSSISNNLVLDIQERNGKLWLATDGDGICILNPEKEEFSQLNTFPANSVFCLHKDQYNNIWAGAVRGGLIGIHEVSLQVYGEVPLKNENGLSEKTVLSLYEDPDSIVWIGTDGGGLNRLNPKTNKFTHYPVAYKSKIVSITEFTGDKLLISEYGRGLSLFDKTTGKTRPFLFRDEERERLVNLRGSAINVMKFTPSQIYLCADSLFVYDLESKLFHPVRLDTENREPVSINTLKVVYSNQYRSYLSGAQSIFELNNKTYTLTPIYTAQYHITIKDVCRDRNGHFWIGTNHGLIHYDPVYQKERLIETKFFSDVSALTIDNRGRLWIGAHGLLFCYLPDQDGIAVLGESDGALPNEYIPNSSLLTSQGDIYMGGNTGLLRIYRDISFDADEKPVVSLTDILMNGVGVNDRILEHNRLTIPWDYSSLVIKVLAKDTDRLRKRMFRFYINGQEDQSIELFNNALTLNYLPPGNYEIKAACSTKEGGWSEPVLLLNLGVENPWWKKTWIRLVGILLTGLVLGIIIRFIFKRKDFHLELEKKEHEKRVYEDRIRFLINISHELRTPLTLIHGPLQRLLRDQSLPEEVHARLLGLNKHTERMKHTINMVLDLHKTEKNDDKLNLQRVNLTHCLDSWMLDFEEELRARSILLEKRWDPSSGLVCMDIPRMRIVISNLLMNAMKFTDPGGAIRIVSEIRMDCFRIEVRDNGIGLDNVDLDKLFTRFYQSDHDRHGSGIGLSMSKEIVEKHGGIIGAYPNTDKGAVFFCELPLLPSEAGPVALPEEPDAVPELPQDCIGEIRRERDGRREHTLLIVEDSADLRDFLKEALSEYFKAVYTAKDGKEGLLLTREQMPDLIISDVMMPRMDGFQMCRHIKENIEISHIPVILLTARGDVRSMAEGYKLGADAYLAKPFDMELLRTLMFNQIRIREQIKKRYNNSILTMTPEEATFSNADEKFLLKLNALITENISRTELDVAFLVKEMGCSKTSLYGKMKTLTGMRINDYINKFKIEKASLLLDETSLSIQEISERTGYSNQRYFSTAFKQATGFTPTGYRSREHAR